MQVHTDVQRELLDLHQRFSEVEHGSVTTGVVAEGHFLVVRLDGVKASKRHLKDHLDNPSFSAALADAVRSTYYLWRHYTHPANSPFLLGALVVSDEVSFVLNNRPSYFQQRVMKIVTTLAGTLSSAMTLAFEAKSQRPAKKGQRPAGHPLVLAFDARPVIVPDLDLVQDYVRWRWLLGCRNATAKVLRLKGGFTGEALFGGEVKLADDIVELAKHVEARNLWADYGRAAGSFTMHVADQHQNLIEHHLPSDVDDGEAVRSVVRLLGRPVGSMDD
jgi:tRNA(His) 5'-end guanylyltransferase